MNFFRSKQFIAFITGCFVFILIQLLINVLWTPYYLGTVSEELIISYQKGFLKPSFDSSATTLLHTELFIAVATILLMQKSHFRNSKCLLFFATGIYIAGFITLMIQNSDSNLWPLALIVYIFFLALPALIAGYTTILFMKTNTVKTK